MKITRTRKPITLPAPILNPDGIHIWSEDDILAAAQAIAEARIRERGRRALNNPADTRRHLVAAYRQHQHEVFTVLYLDSQHRIIATEEEARGTIDGAAIYPREIVRAALRHGAAAVILAHNHPSGVAEPSLADRQITRRLVDALALVDVRVLDHIVVGAAESVSFAERGLM